MTEQQNNEAPESQARPSTGQILKTAREALGIELTDLADQIKVSVSVLEAIEVDRIPKNLPETFIRGYIRSYARKVGIDETLVLTEVKTTAAFTVPEMSAQEMQSFSRRTKKQAFERRLKLVSYIILSILIFALVLWWYQDSNNTDIAPLAGGDTATATKVEVQPGSVADEQTSLQSIDVSPQVLAEQSEDLTEAELQSSTQGENEQQNADSNTPESEPEVVTEVNENLTDAQNNELDAVADMATEEGNEPIELTEEQRALLADAGEVDQEGYIKVEMLFEHECWVEVYDVNDERIAVGNKPAGYLMTLNAQGPFNVLLGNPVGVTIWVNGKKFDTESLPRNRVARFELDDADVSS